MIMLTFKSRHLPWLSTLPGWQKLLGGLVACLFWQLPSQGQTIGQRLQSMNMDPSGAAPMYCPPADKLRKDPVRLTWAYPTVDSPMWRSFSLSFFPTLTQFLGAQWQGVRVGVVTCLYKGEKEDFPVELRFNKLVFEPSSGQWSENLNGYRNCKSNNLANCPFAPVLPKKSNNIYEEAGRLKSGPSQELGY